MNRQCATEAAVGIALAHGCGAASVIGLVGGCKWGWWWRSCHLTCDPSALLSLLHWHDEWGRQDEGTNHQNSCVGNSTWSHAVRVSTYLEGKKDCYFRTGEFHSTCRWNGFNRCSLVKFTWQGFTQYQNNGWLGDMLGLFTWSGVHSATFTAMAELFCRGCKILWHVVKILPSHFMVTCYPYKEVQMTTKCDGKILTMCHPFGTPQQISPAMAVLGDGLGGLGSAQPA